MTTILRTDAPKRLADVAAGNRAWFTAFQRGRASGRDQALTDANEMSDCDRQHHAGLAIEKETW